METPIKFAARLARKSHVVEDAPEEETPLRCRELLREAGQLLREAANFIVGMHDAPDIRQFLERPHWPQTLTPMMRYQRYEDDSQKGSISVVFSDDGDGWLGVYSDPDPDDLHFGMRFRVPFHGGGDSPRVRAALFILAEAIRLDNENKPQRRGA